IDVVPHRKLLPGHAARMPHRHGDCTGQLLWPAAPETHIRQESQMKRFHVHVAVDDLAANIRFYSTVFGQSPTVEKRDYAKWMLDDPRVNFAISQRGLKAGLDHLGLQVESDEELSRMRAQVHQA